MGTILFYLMVIGLLAIGLYLCIALVTIVAMLLLRRYIGRTHGPGYRQAPLRLPRNWLPPGLGRKDTLVKGPS
jgi:hypothetical protein